MMKRGYILFLLVALLLPGTLAAQTLTNQQKRNILDKVLTVVEEYERLASLAADGDEYEFKQLFVDGATVDSDIMGDISYMNSVTVDEYIKRLQSAGVYTEIRDVRKSELSYSERGWRIPISFSKQLYYYDSNGVYFNVRKYYGEDINVVMNLLYNDETDMCYIESVNVRSNSSKQFPKGKFLIVDNNGRSEYSRADRYFHMLKADNAPLSFDENGYAIYGANTQFTVDDYDVEVIHNNKEERATEAYNFVDFDFVRRSQRAKLKLAYAPFAYNVSGNDRLSKSKSNAFDVGIDYGFTFSSRRKSKMGMFFGAGLSFSSVTLGLGKELKNTHVVPSLNTNTGMYEMNSYTYTITNAVEQVSYMDLYVPVYFEIEHMLGSKGRVMLSWNFGVKSYLNLSAKAKTPYTVTFNTLVNKESIELTTTFESFIDPNTYEKNLFDLSAIANLGVDCNVVKNRLYVNASVGYEHGIMDSYVSNKQVYSNPILPKVNKNGSVEHVAVNSLISGLTINRQALWISLGLKYKF